MTQAALFGGLFIGVLSALPIVSIGNCCCLWIIGGGVLAAYVCQQQEGVSLTAGRGALAGAAAGLVGAFVWLAVSLAVNAVMAPFQERFFEGILESAGDMPPEVRQLFESLASGDGSSFGYALGFLFMLFVGSAFAALGGVIGASFFRRDVPPALGGPIAPPPAPPPVAPPPPLAPQ
jgi:hypothetical protein